MVFKRKANGLKKRWTVEGSFMGAKARLSSRSLAKRSLDTHIKNVIRNQVLEPKVTISGDVTSPTMVHNTFYTYNILKDINQGTGDTQREGDYINIKHVSYRIHFLGNSAGLTDFVKLRVMVVKSKIADTTSGIISAHIGAGDIFYTGASDLMIAQHNPRECSLLYDKTYQVAPQISSQKVSKLIDFKINLPKYVYEETSQTGKFFNYYLCFIPYIDRGTTGTTTVGDVIFNSLIHFTDGK